MQVIVNKLSKAQVCVCGRARAQRPHISRPPAWESRKELALYEQQATTTTTTVLRKKKKKKNNEGIKVHKIVIFGFECTGATCGERACVAFLLYILYIYKKDELVIFI